MQHFFSHRTQIEQMTQNTLISVPFEAENALSRGQRCIAEMHSCIDEQRLTRHMSRRIR